MSTGSVQIDSIDEWKKILGFTSQQVYKYYIKDKEDLYALLADSWIRSIDMGIPDFVFIENGSNIKVGRVLKNTAGRAFEIRLFELSTFNSEFKKFVTSAEPQYLSADILASFMRLLLDVELTSDNIDLLSAYHKQLINNAEQFVYSKNTKENSLDVVISNAQTEKELMKWIMQAGAYSADLWTNQKKPANSIDTTQRLQTIPKKKKQRSPPVSSLSDEDGDDEDTDFQSPINSEDEDTQF